MIVYKIINKINSKVYIGKTEKTLQHRWKRHLYLAKHKVNRYLYDAMNHYGIENFLIKEIEKCTSSVILNKREIFWIKEYDSMNKEKGYNMQSGGTGGKQNKETLIKIGKKVSIANSGKERVPRIVIKCAECGKEFRIRISEVKRKKYCSFDCSLKGLSKSKIGKVYSKSHRKNISKSLKGKKKSKDHCAKIRNRDMSKIVGKGNGRYKQVDKDILLAKVSKGDKIVEVANYFNISNATVGKKFKEYFNTTITEFRKTSKYKHISFDKQRDKWVLQVYSDELNKKYMKRFTTEAKAYEAYLVLIKKEKELL